MHEREYNLNQALGDVEKLDSATEQSEPGSITKDISEQQKGNADRIEDLHRIISSPEAPIWPKTIYQVAGFIPNPDEPFVELKPGTHNAAGIGAYFTESLLQFKYTGGERNQRK